MALTSAATYYLDLTLFAVSGIFFLGYFKPHICTPSLSATGNTKGMTPNRRIELVYIFGPCLLQGVFRGPIVNSGQRVVKVQGKTFSPAIDGVKVHPHMNEMGIEWSAPFFPQTRNARFGG
ncbi:hypothetical protein AVEN_142144-1 [Araneus ventricosus]|uniref:Uncharacterized protein n=1 Tax=Araneus ventricosus TaxID=182803 RepID=A0A4Y2DFB5_ARAVE|nr:hypothetical protein AVEN_142144-1 [Araneus ventricosus]